MRIDGWNYPRKELLRRVGNIAQVGGISLTEYAEGHSRGVRSLDIRTGTGFQFGVLPDRGLDVGRAEFQGVSLAWLAPKMFPAPWYYEGGEGDPYGFVRTALGGLFNTCGLVHIGDKTELPTDHYGYGTRMTERYGIHDRIAMTPADRFNYGEDWDGERRRLWVEGTVRQELAYGENLLLTRRYDTELGSNSFTWSDVVRNDGYYTSPHQVLYHFNIGFPLVDSTSELLCTIAEDAEDLATVLSNFDKGVAEREKFRNYVEPQPKFGVEAYGVRMAADSDGMVGVALVNRAVRPERGGVGVYLRYREKELPHYIAWRQMAEGLYAVGLEPATNPFSTPAALLEKGYPVMLEPGEERSYKLEFGVLDGGDAIDAFKKTLPAK
jgi:hypothetical protein